MSKIISIQWNNLSNITIQLADNLAADYLWESLKHLQHLPLQFDKFAKDNPYNEMFVNAVAARNELVKAASKVNVIVPETQELTQDYLNQLHEIYEKQYDGKKQQWLEFHEMIHLNETYVVNRRLPDALLVNPIGFDWREKAGTFIKPYNRSFNKFAVTELPRGSVYLKWQELGKRPYRYWFDKEPDDIKRICELAKPWDKIKPSFYITTKDIRFDAGIDLEKFDQWFKPFKQEWCDHWGLDNWTSKEMYTVLPVGTIDDIDQLIKRLQDKQYPVKIKRL